MPPAPRRRTERARPDVPPYLAGRLERCRLHRVLPRTMSASSSMRGLSTASPGSSVWLTRRCQTGQGADSDRVHVPTDRTPLGVVGGELPGAAARSESDG